MIKAIAYHYNPTNGMYFITCEEGTSWMIEATYLRVDSTPVYSPYTGNRVQMVAMLGAMKSHLPFHQD